MSIQWTHCFKTVVITQHPNSPISKINSLYDGFKSVWSMFPYNTLHVNECQLYIYKQKMY